jgi:hypothetical protein
MSTVDEGDWENVDSEEVLGARQSVSLQPAGRRSKIAARACGVRRLQLELGSVGSEEGAQPAFVLRPVCGEGWRGRYTMGELACLPSCCLGRPMLDLRAAAASTAQQPRVWQMRRCCLTPHCCADASIFGAIIVPAAAA